MDGAGGEQGAVGDRCAGMGSREAQSLGAPRVPTPGFAVKPPGDSQFTLSPRGAPTWAPENAMRLQRRRE